MRAALDRWLAGRGFRESDEAVLFDLDADAERSAFLISNDRWTLLFFSHYEEERRLIRELQTELAPLLYLWVYDSDVWGYDLFASHGFDGSFSSDPRDYQSFGDDVASHEQRPLADPAHFAETFQLAPEAAGEIGKIQRQAGAFKEDACRQLCQLLGAEPALASYDDLETGAIQHQEGWQRQQLLYFNHDVASATLDREADLHSVAAELSASRIPTQQLEFSPELLAEMEQMRRRVRWTLMILKPISFLARIWRHTYEVSHRWFGSARPKPAKAEPDSPLTVQPTETATRHEVINSRHQARILLPQGTEPVKVSGKPSAVFAFRCGSTPVTCTARRLRYLPEVMRRPSRSKTQRDERYHVGSLQARHLLFELPPGFVADSQTTNYLALHIVQTFKGLYVFLYRTQGYPDAAVEASIRSAVESFRMLEEKPTHGRR